MTCCVDDSQPLFPAIFIIVQWAHGKVAMVEGMEDMHGLNNMDLHSPRVTWLWLLHGDKFSNSRDQHWTSSVTPFPCVASQWPGSIYGLHWVISTVMKRQCVVLTGINTCSGYGFALTAHHNFSFKIPSTGRGITNMKDVCKSPMETYYFMSYTQTHTHTPIHMHAHKTVQLELPWAEDKSPPRNLRLPNKKPKAWYLLFSCWRGVFQRFSQTIYHIASALGCLPELDIKTLLLRTPYILVTWHGEIKLVLTKKLSPYWTAFRVLEITM